MDSEVIKSKIFEILEKAKGKKKLKEKDIIRMASEDLNIEKDEAKKNLRELIEEGKLCYSYGGGASSVEIPTEEYLREKGLL